MTGSAVAYPMVARTTATQDTSNSVWAATWSMAEWSPRPLYWAKRTVPAIGSPAPIAIIRKLIGKERDTAATAWALSRPTQNVSVSW